MGGLLRRREMLQASGGPTGPLYAFEDDTWEPDSYCTYTVSNGNHFSQSSTRRGHGVRCTFPQFIDTEAAIDWQPLFTLHAGDSVTMKLKNIYVTGRIQGNYFTATFHNVVDGAGNALFGFIGDDKISWGIQRSSYHIADKTMTVTIAADADIYWFHLYQYAAQASYSFQTFEFDLELYVNGVRYI